jgi:hypothetical protein
VSKAVDSKAWKESFFERETTFDLSSRFDIIHGPVELSWMQLSWSEFARCSPLLGKYFGVFAMQGKTAF